MQAVCKIEIFLLVDADVRYDTSASRTKKNTRRKTQIKKRLWTTAEKQAVLKHFTNQVKEGSLPGKIECEKCIDETPCLKGRKWTDLKFYIKNHLFKLNKMKSK